MLEASEISAFTHQALDLVLSNSAPAMITAAVAGVAIALLQALTQIQDQGLPTAVKFFAVMGALYATYQGVAHALLSFGELLFTRIATI